MRIFSASLLLSLPLLLAACGGSNEQSVTTPVAPKPVSPPPEFSLNTITKEGIIGKNVLKFAWDGTTIGNTYTLCLKDEKDATLKDFCRPLATGTDVNFLEASLPNLLEDHSATFFIMASNGGGKTISSEKQIENDVVNALISVFTDEKQVENAFFGTSLDISENGLTMIVGAIGENELNNELNGSANVYVKKEGTQWSFKTKLTPKDPNYRKGFGQVVAISGDGQTIAVSAIATKNISYGAVHIFKLKNGTWVEDHLIEGNKFSNTLNSISLSDDGKVLVIGGQYINEPNAMTIFVLSESNVWEFTTGFETEEVKKVKINKQGDFIAASLSAFTTENGVVSGVVKLFSLKAGTWSEEAIIEPSRPTEYMDFGSSFTMNDAGTLMAIGSSKDNAFPEGQNIEKSGSVYIYNKTNTVWNQIAHLKGSNTKANDQFGFSVAFNSDASQLAVGAIYNDSNRKGLGLLNNVDPENWNRTNSGAVYVFALQEDIWNETKFIKAPDRFFHDKFGTSLAWSKQKELIVSAPKRDEKTMEGENITVLKTDTGAFYVY